MSWQDSSFLTEVENYFLYAIASRRTCAYCDCIRVGVLQFPLSGFLSRFVWKYNATGSFKRGSVTLEKVVNECVANHHTRDRHASRPLFTTRMNARSNALVPLHAWRSLCMHAPPHTCLHMDERKKGGPNFDLMDR